MRGLYKRGRIWWVCYKSIDERVVRVSTEKADHDEAVDFLLKRKAEVKAGIEPEHKNITNYIFNELVAEYIKWAERQKCFKSKIYLINQLAEAYGSLPLRRFNSMLLEQYQTERLNKGNKPATANRLIATISHMFTKAVEWDMVEEEILKRIRKVKMLPENNKRLRYLSKDECQTLIKTCQGNTKAIVITALNTGMRKGEILSLRWDNLDLKHGFILLNQDQTKNSERREIPINDTLRGVLQGITRRLDIPYVFYDSIIGKPFQDVKRSFNTALRKAGIKDFHFHDLRHTFASHLVMAGIDLVTVKELLGHKTLTMTLRYAHLAPSHKVKAVDVLDRTINKNSTSHLLHNLAINE
jgi:integrase